MKNNKVNKESLIMEYNIIVNILQENVDYSKLRNEKCSLLFNELVNMANKY